MTEFGSIDDALHAAIDPLTSEERRSFYADIEVKFPDLASLAAEDRSAAMDRAWHIAGSMLLCDPLDPIGEAWARFATSLFTPLSES